MRASYPFTAIVGQSELKLALLLAAVDWRLGVLLRGDKGSGKTTAARALAALLPPPAPFVNLPVGATEDRLLGGLDLDRTLRGEPVLKPGLLGEAHGGVLYADEVNLLPAHLGDALLDTAASGVHLVEREGLSASHPAEFVLLGSMNPEEGSLRPQLLDRFALSVHVSAPVDSAERLTVLERRLAFDRDPQEFARIWSEEQQVIRTQIALARSSSGQVVCTQQMLQQISQTICEHHVRSLRADLAATRAAIAYAALCGQSEVAAEHVAAVMPLALAHRAADRERGGTPRQQNPQRSPAPPQTSAQEEPAGAALDRIFTPLPVDAPAIKASFAEQPDPKGDAAAERGIGGPVVGTRPSPSPVELDLRASLNHALLETGALHLRPADLHERMRSPRTGTRYLFVVDSSGSQAAQQRMRLVKGAATASLQRSFTRDDEVAIILFRGTNAQVLLEPTRNLSDALAAFEYMPTGGRTPLAHALELAKTYVTPSTLLLLLTDGAANVALHGTDAWQDALEAAGGLRCTALVVQTGDTRAQADATQRLAKALHTSCLSLSELSSRQDLRVQCIQSR